MNHNNMTIDKTFDHLMTADGYLVSDMFLLPIRTTRELNTLLASGD